MVFGKGFGFSVVRWVVFLMLGFLYTGRPSWRGTPRILIPDYWILKLIRCLCSHISRCLPSARLLRVPWVLLYRLRTLFVFHLSTLMKTARLGAFSLASVSNRLLLPRSVCRLHGGFCHKRSSLSTHSYIRCSAFCILCVLRTSVSGRTFSWVFGLVPQTFVPAYNVPHIKVV